MIEKQRIKQNQSRKCQDLQECPKRRTHSAVDTVEWHISRDNAWHIAKHVVNVASLTTSKEYVEMHHNRGYMQHVKRNDAQNATR